MLMQEQGATSRAGSAAFIVLAHVLFVLALVHYASPRPDNANMPVDYIAFAFIVAPERPVPPPAPMPQARSAPAPVSVQIVRPPRIATQRAMPASPEPMTIIAAPQETPSATPAETTTAPAPAPAPASTGKLDMESLRGLARQVEKERVPTALERVRTAEQLRGADDTNLSRAIKKAKNPDCQTKYSGGDKLDLIRLIPLAIDTITGTGCTW
jgi:hypothetical protein